jgi:hypothetical protein
MNKLRFIILLLFLFLPSVVSAQSLNEDLLAATRKSDAAKVKALLDQGADVNAKSPYGATPLFFACDRGNVEIVKILLERGADVNVKDTFYGATPLGWALGLGKGDPEIIRMLVEKGAKEKDQALTFAINGGHSAVAKAALDKGGFEQNALDKALRAAQSKGNKEIIELLKAAGAKEIAEFKVTPETLKMYEGTFKNDNLTLVLTVKDGKLIGTVNGFDNVLVPISQHGFEIEQSNGVTVTFTLESDKVTGLTLQTPNGKFNLKKGEAK